ncbi:hypothetical protein JHK85_024951 [Glycine max]|nr:hypothetical protein JHK85_024951 [Glycine max]
MLDHPKPLKLPHCTEVPLRACGNHMTVLRRHGPPLQWKVETLNLAIGGKGLYHVGVHEQLKNANQTTRACARRLVYGAKAEAAIAIGFDDYDFRCIASHEPVAVKRSHEPPLTVEGASSASTVEVMKLDIPSSLNDFEHTNLDKKLNGSDN